MLPLHPRLKFFVAKHLKLAEVSKHIKHFRGRTFRVAAPNSFREKQGERSKSFRLQGVLISYLGFFYYPILRAVSTG